MLVRTLRRERAWTQEQLALILGVSVRTVQRLEAGAAPSLETAQALAGAFGCDAQLFLPQPPVATSPTEGLKAAPAPPPRRAARPHAATTSHPFGDLKPRMYAAAYLLVGGGLASILILALLVAGPSSPALLAPLFASAMCVALVVWSPSRRRGPSAPE